MKLANMEMSSEERKEQMGSMVADAPRYPYGLEIRLDDDGLEKLGIADFPKSGSTMILTARVSVSGTSERQEASGESERSMSLQITHMALGPDVEPSDAAKNLYGGKAS